MIAKGSIPSQVKIEDQSEVNSLFETYTYIIICIPKYFSEFKNKGSSSSFLKVCTFSNCGSLKTKMVDNLDFFVICCGCDRNKYKSFDLLLKKMLD